MSEMSAVESFKPPRRRGRLLLGVLSCLLIAILLAAWWWHGAVLSRLAERAVPHLAAAAGWRVEIGRANIRLGQPIVLTEVEVEELDREEPVTRLRAGLVRVVPGTLGQWLAGDPRWIHRLEVRDLTGQVDIRPPAPGTPVAAPPGWSVLKPWIPVILSLEQATVVLRGTDQVIGLRDVSFTLSEENAGRLRAGAVDLDLGGWRRGFRALEGVTAWREGVIYAADLDLGDGVRLNRFSGTFLEPSGAAMEVDLQGLGGYARADLVVGGPPEAPDFQAAVRAGGISVGGLASFLRLDVAADGRLSSVKGTFRGDPGRPLDGQAVLRLEAEDFRWQDRTAEALQLGAELNNRRLKLEQLSLRQEGNALTARGEGLVPARWEEVAGSDFELTLSADLRDPGRLLALAGMPPDWIGGSVLLDGTLTGRDGRLDGWLGLRAWQGQLRGVPVTSARADFLLQGREVSMAGAEIWSGKDFLRASGRLALDTMRSYAGRLELRAAEVTRYLAPLGAAAPEFAREGGVLVFWEGDGTADSHSGAFTLELVRFTGEWNNVPVNARIAGTYSPDNLYLSRVLLDRGPLSLSTALYFGERGLSLQGVEMFNRRSRLLEGEIYLPLSFSGVLQGKPVVESILPAVPAYARVRSEELEIKDLAALFGQNLPVGGRVRLNMTGGGPLGALRLEASLLGEKLGWRGPEIALPTSSLELDLNVAEDQAKLSGSWRFPGFDPVTLSASLPVQLSAVGERGLRILDPAAPLRVEAQLPKLDLASFRARLPDLRDLRGVVSGRVAVRNTLADPRMEGRLELTGGRVDFTLDTPTLDGLEAAVVFDGSEARLTRLAGTAGAGPFEASGRLDWRDPRNLRYELDVRGRKVLLHRDESLRLRADIEAAVRGDSTGGSVRGSIGLVDGRFFKSLELRPLLFPNPYQETPGRIPVPVRVSMAPFAAWTLDLRLHDATPFLIGGGLATGRIIPDLYLQGTLGEPLLLGTITVDNVQANLPFASLLINHGRIHFTRADPFMPILDIEAVSDVQGFDVRALAYGPLSERRLILTSDPPLSPDQIVLLLTTGIPPDIARGDEFGTVAIGQGSLFLARQFLSSLNLPWLNPSALLGRLQVTTRATPGLYETTTAQRATLKVTRDFSIYTEREGAGYYNAGVTYTWRFR